MRLDRHSQEGLQQSRLPEVGLQIHLLSFLAFMHLTCVTEGQNEKLQYFCSAPFFPSICILGGGVTMLGRGVRGRGGVDGRLNLRGDRDTMVCQRVSLDPTLNPK